MAFRKRKNADVNGLDVLEDVKEPFSFANFFEDHVVGRIKKCWKKKVFFSFCFHPFSREIV